MSSLQSQLQSNSTDKPSTTKYGHATPSQASGLDENPAVSSAKRPQGTGKTGTERAGAKESVSQSEAQNPNSLLEQNGQEYEQP